MIDSITALNDVVTSRLRLIQKAAQKNSVTSAEWKLLALIEQGTLTQEQLVQKTNLAASTISRQIKRCFEKELVGTEPMEIDRRQVKYHLTELGQVTLKNVNKMVFEINAKMFAHWTDEEISMFNILANRILRNLKYDLA